MWGYIGRAVLASVATTVIRVLIMHKWKKPPRR